MTKVLTVALLMLTGSLSGAEGEKQRVETTSTERVSFAPGGIIRLENSFGDLTVEGWDRPEVEITVTKSIDHEFEPGQREQAAKRLESLRVTTERRSDTELAISTVRASRKNSVTPEYEIHAPRNSRLIIRHRGGFVLVSEMSGDVEAANRNGDIVLLIPDLTSCSISARSRMGAVSSDVHTTPANPRHRIYLRTGFGGITLKAE